MSAVAVLDHAVDAGPAELTPGSEAGCGRIRVARVDGEFDAAIAGQFHDAISKAIVAEIFRRYTTVYEAVRN
ncbi:hypothetical protein [Nocardia aurantia]|uniref:Uncharacterized protein n=1 Tax=Nocardia aurantia TaxID=2585199 RepID=A0A7K0DRR0_9NOCA|nr:hypothetical protein [Nocardia aurantia]MQY27504.1 hypothetical protein [Nocardia aurantia]